MTMKQVCYPKDTTNERNHEEWKGEQFKCRLAVSFGPCERNQAHQSRGKVRERTSSENRAARAAPRSCSFEKKATVRMLRMLALSQVRRVVYHNSAYAEAIDCLTSG